MTPRHLRTRSPILLLAALLLLATSLEGCAAAAKLDNIEVEVSAQAQVPGETLTDVVLGGFPELDGFRSFDISDSAAFQNSKYGPDDVDSVRVKRLTMRTIEPPDQDLAFFGKVTFSVETDGKPRIVIAEQSEFPAGATSVNFATSGADIKDYVLANEGNIVTDIEDTQRPPQDTTVEVRVVFDVDIKIL